MPKNRKHIIGSDKRTFQLYLLNLKYRKFNFISNGIDLVNQYKEFFFCRMRKCYILGAI